MNRVKIQYVTDPEGIRKAVMIPIEEWERIEAQIKALLEYGSLKESLKQGFLDVKEIVSGKEKAQKIFLMSSKVVVTPNFQREAKKLKKKYHSLKVLVLFSFSKNESALLFKKFHQCRYFLGQ